MKQEIGTTQLEYSDIVLGGIMKATRRGKNIDLEADHDQTGRHLRRKADAVRIRRLRKLHRRMSRSSYLDSQVKHGRSTL